MMFLAFMNIGGQELILVLVIVLVTCGATAFHRLARIRSNGLVPSRILDSRSGRNRGRGRLGRHVSLAGRMQLVSELVFCFLEFFDRLTHAAGELGKLLRSEEHENDNQDKDELLSPRYS